jgi:hypothetical protein
MYVCIDVCHSIQLCTSPYACLWFISFSLVSAPCLQVLSKSTDGDLPLSSESGVYTALHDLTKSFERTPAISSWKTIKPPPTSLIWKADQADHRCNNSNVNQLPQ